MMEPSIPNARMHVLVFLFVFTAVSGYNHFCGGSISFELYVDPEDPTKLNAHFDVITGWILGQGPCGPNCSVQSIEQSTLNQREAIENNASFGINYFGEWTLEHGVAAEKTILSDQIKGNMTEKVIAVSEFDLWEQERMKFELTIDNEDADFYNIGDYYHSTNFQTNTSYWKFQAKIRHAIRNDTTRPNQSPKAMFKPIYRVQLDAVSEISLTVADPDGDFVKCHEPYANERGGVSLSNYILANNVKLVTPFQKMANDCIISINASKANGFTDDTWFIYIVSLRDYNTKLILLGDVEMLPPYQYALSFVPIQFLVHVVDNLTTPTFIKPTWENGHEFELEVGVKWSETVIAEPAYGRTIDKIDVQPRNGEKIQKTELFDYSTVPGAKGLNLSWTPSDKTDIGPHILCINAVDNTGMDTQTDERCFILHVKGPLDRTSNDSSIIRNNAGPYFISLPDSYGENKLACRIMVSCLFQVVVHSEKELDRIETSSESVYYTKSGITASANPKEYVMNFQFTHNTTGILEICFKAFDFEGKTSELACLNGTVVGHDPCVSIPCKNGGICHWGEDDSFYCECRNGRVGFDCSDQIDFCASIPCQNEGTCNNHFATFMCKCLVGYSGSQCEFKINTCEPDECSPRGICISNGDCQCYPRFSGQNCSNDSSPGLNQTEVNPNNNCANVTCHNGLCVGTGECSCNLGFTGSYCTNASEPSSTKLAFIEPTLAEGASIVCYFDENGALIPCMLRVYMTTPSSTVPGLTLSRGTGTLQNDSHVGTVLTETGRINTFMTDITVGGTKANGHNIICVKATDNTNNIERCFEINFQKDQKLSSVTREYKQNTSALSSFFIDPTYLSDSAFICNVNQRCYFRVYTSKPGADCMTVPTPQRQFVVHEPIEVNSGSCMSEISYQFAIAKRYEFCLQSSLTNGETRCYTFYIDSGNDPCIPNPCLNGGICARRSSGHTCICPNEVSGDRCENGPCFSPSQDCVNGMCISKDGNQSCICQQGHSGDFCNISTNIASTVNPKGFTDSSQLASVTCFLNKPCTISLPLTGNPNITKPGFLSHGATISQISTASHRAQVELLIKDPGTKDVCIQTLDQGVMDELCFKVAVTTDSSILYNRNDMPNFIEPSLPPRSVVRCLVDSTCHVSYTATTGGTNSCLSVKVSGTNLPVYNVFSTCNDCTQPYQNCSIDLAFKPTSGTAEFSIELMTRGAMPATGEQRSFTISLENATQLQVRGSCKGAICENGGFCDGHETSPKCICPEGFNGSSCNSSTANSPGIATNQETFNGHRAIPQTINCVLNEPCMIPFSSQTNPSLGHELSLGFASPSLSVNAIELQNVDAHSSYVKVTPTGPGQHTLCLQKNTLNLTTDELCVSINVGGGPYVDMGRAHFIGETYPDESTVACEVKKTCHLFVFYNHASKCPNIEDVSAIAVESLYILPTKESSNECSNDITYTATTPGVVDLCLELSLDGRRGERRCFKIKAVTDYSQSVSSKCAGIICAHGGKCLSDGQNKTSYKCVCTKGYSGINCDISTQETKLPGVPTNIQGLPAPVSGVPTYTTFDGSTGVPTRVICQLSSPCTIPVNYIGVKPPVLGFVDQSLSLSNETKSSGDYNTLLTTVNTATPGSHKLCLQTTHDGTSNGIKIDEICFTVEVNGSATTTGSIHAPNGSKFEAPTLPSGSSVMCLIDTTCHLTMVTPQISGECDNDLVGQCGEGVSGIHVFPPIKDDTKCVTDVAYLTDHEGSHDLCLRAGKNGQEYHYTLQTNNSYEYGPCQKKHCLHGTCISDTDVARCHCEHGYLGDVCDKVCHSGGLQYGEKCICPASTSGDFCQLSSGVPSTNISTPIDMSPPSFPDNFLPGSVSCQTNTTCQVTIPITAKCDLLPTVQHGAYSNNLQVTPLLVTKLTTPTSHVGNMCQFETIVEIKPTTSDQARYCVQTADSSGVNADELCFDVNKHGGPVPGVTPPFINTASVPAGSTLVCLINQTCHTTITTRNNSGTCENVTLEPPSTNVVIFQPNAASNSCKFDIAIMPDPNQNNICLKSTTGAGNDKYCINVEGHTNIAPSPCRTLHCQNGGTCVFDASNATCQCPDGITGVECGTVQCENGGQISGTKCICRAGTSGDHCQLLVGAQPTIISTPKDTSPPSFTDMFLPKSVSCPVNSPCFVTIPLTAKCDQMPTVKNGTFSANLQVILQVTNSTSATSNTGDKCQFETIVEIKPTTLDQARYCVQTTDSSGVNADEMCFDVNPNATTAGVVAPSFIKSASVPVDSTLVCPVNQTCHLFVTTHNNSGTCVDVKLDQHPANMVIFPPSKASTDCKFDVAFTPDPSLNGTTSNLCLQEATTTGRSEFCVKFEAKEQTDIVLSQCQTLHCQNSGTCVSNGSIASCQCPNGTTGAQCENGQCSGKTMVRKAKAAIKGGMTRCYCMVNDKKVEMVRQNPVVPRSDLMVTAGMGAGGMAALFGLGTLAKVVMNRANKPPASNSDRPQRKKSEVEENQTERRTSRVHPQ